MSSLSTGRKVIVKAALSSDIEQALQRLYAEEHEAALSAETGVLTAESTEADLARLRESASEAPVIRFVNSLVSKAVEAGASDIHIEPFEKNVVVRFRIDGILYDEDQAPKQRAAAIASRIKVMAELNIAEKRIPQDGRVKIKIANREIDIRLSVIPVVHGERLVPAAGG
jgi:general secretion pathway protein E